MRLGDIIKAANNLADEDFSSSQVVEFVNDALAKINIACSSDFPFMSADEVSDYNAFPDKWQRAMFIPFVVGRIKAVDSSQFEYNDNYSEFASNLEVFKVKYQIPDAYKDANDVKRFEDSFSSNPWGWVNYSAADDPLNE
jgi:hypothetical protein